MQLYKDIYDIPISNLNKVQESLLKDKPNYSHLVKSGKARRWHKKLLKKTYFDLLYQMPSIDIELNRSFLEYHLEMQKYINYEQINEERKELELEPIKIKKYDANKAFEVYFEKLQATYTDFELEICFLNPDFEKLYKKVTGKDVPEGFKYDLEFFFIDEFMKYVYSFEDSDLNIAVFAGYDMFVKSEIRTFSNDTYSIKQINDRLDKFFRETKQYDKWFLIRYNYFNLKKLDFRADERQTILNDVITLSRILDQDIDIDKITVGQLYSNYKTEADKLSKPKAAGYAG